jgi:hypothetical protein
VNITVLESVSNKNILFQLNIVRAIASMGVWLMHLSLGGHLFDSPDPIAQITQYGHLGSLHVFYFIGICDLLFHFIGLLLHRHFDFLI